MKTIFLFLLIQTFQVSSQSVKPILDALVKSDQNQLNRYFSHEVSLELDGNTLTGREGVISKLEEFISFHTIKSAKLVHEGVTKGKESFMGIGNLMSDKVKYRVYLMFGQGELKNQVKEVRIEKDLF